MAGDMETAFQTAIHAGKINGAIVCATNTKGDFVFNNAFGSRTLLSGEKKSLQVDDVCFLASATKLITSIAALQCVEDGLLGLEEDVSMIAPELAEKQVLTGFTGEDDTPVLEPAARPITLKMLLTHSAGTAYHFLVPSIGKWRQKHGPIQEGQQLTVEQRLKDPLLHHPGAGWMYGPGHDWAGRILERLTGHSLGEHVLARILAPLGADDAEFYPVTRQDLRERLIDLNPDDPDALGRAVIGSDDDMMKRGKGHSGGHSLFMSALSYAKVLHSLLANDGKILKPATVDAMFRDHLSAESAAAHRAELNGLIGPHFRVGVDAEVKMGHGLGGLLTLEDVEGWYGANTLTWGGGLTLTWFIDRKRDLCGVTALHASLPMDVGAMTELKQVFRKDIYAKYAAWKRQ